MVRSVRWMVHSTLPHTQLTFRVRMMAMVELLDFVEQGQAEGLLAMEVEDQEAQLLGHGEGGQNREHE